MKKAITLSALAALAMSSGVENTNDNEFSLASELRKILSFGNKNNKPISKLPYGAIDPSYNDLSNKRSNSQAQPLPVLVNPYNGNEVSGDQFEDNNLASELSEFDSLIRVKPNKGFLSVEPELIESFKPVTKQPEEEAYLESLKILQDLLVVAFENDGALLGSKKLQSAIDLEINELEKLSQKRPKVLIDFEVVESIQKKPKGLIDFELTEASLGESIQKKPKGLIDFELFDAFLGESIQKKPKGLIDFELFDAFAGESLQKNKKAKYIDFEIQGHLHELFGLPKVVNRINPPK